jgi:hypothetical protein
MGSIFNPPDPPPPPPPVPVGTAQVPRDLAEEARERARRLRRSTLATGYRGLLDLAVPSARKSLLGE